MKEYINEWRKQRAKEEDELKRLKEKQAKRKVRLQQNQLVMNSAVLTLADWFIKHVLNNFRYLALKKRSASPRRRRRRKKGEFAKLKRRNNATSKRRGSDSRRPRRSARLCSRP